MSIGVVVLIALFWGIAGLPIEGWNERPGAPGAKYRIPTTVCAIASVVGECLGLAGISLAWRRGPVISPLSTLGTAFCLGQMYRFFLHIFWVSLL
jgi:hypothetical protein